MSLNLEDKFIVLEYDSCRVDPGPALILFQIKHSKPVTKYDPRDHPCTQLDFGECEAVRQYLKDKEVREVYSPKEVVPMPKFIFDLELEFDDDFEWGLYRPLGRCYWPDFFSREKIMLKEFDPSKL